ncbi:IclR family transcriptional regulator [Kineosporia sp. J2-2]|uniref:IclR family transcriptional regulator n=1 Tax=Kineosporia corallincola TaxID=2835133 RepID=A0ABS5T8L1_9ACTN|nr:IclR family transcriptional regulator [Kineosporia corallincola]MBT0767404.1 IclR family transcriptional regulator [Kineosporia corallincola]
MPKHENPGQVPAATRALAVLRALARAPGPLPAGALARELDLPRSTVYHLLTAMIEQGFVTHLPEERRYGLGVAAFEIGSAYSRQEPLQRLSRLVLSRLVDAVGHTAHLGVLHGREVLYLIEERAPGRPPLVTDVGVRLPSERTASGRAMLSALPNAQVRALFPGRDAFVGAGPPSSLPELRRMLAGVRRVGHAVETDEVTPGFSSVAVAVLDHNGHPVAALAVTRSSGPAGDGGEEKLVASVKAAATALERRLHGGGRR